MYAYNVPRYYTVMLRAREFARVHQRRSRWCVARDCPLHRDDRDLPGDQLDAKRSRWLLRHDQHTAHLASSLPLAPGLPVRITEAIDRGRHLFRGRRGRSMAGRRTLRRPVKKSTAPDYCIARRRQFTSSFQVPVDHRRAAAGSVPHIECSRELGVNKYTNVKARRTGFFIVPDFASTAHMIQGSFRKQLSPP